MTRQLPLPLGYRLPAPTLNLLTTLTVTGAVVALLLPALQPLLFGHMPRGADGLLHMHRLAQLERAVQGGLLYPRWLPDMAFGFGFPLFNYYAPLSYYLLLPLLAIGIPVEAAMQAGYVMALLAIAGGIYLWTRDLFGREAGMVAAVAAVYGPYILYDVHHRGVLPEVWGLAWLTLTFWSLHRLVSRPGRRSLALTTLFYAALLISHNILALIGTPLLIAYAAFLMWTSSQQAKGNNQPPAVVRIPPANTGRWRLTLLPLLALLLGLGFATFFWLPAFAEKEFVQIQQLYLPEDFHYANHFLSLPELVARPKVADAALINAELSFSLGWPQLVLALLCWLPLPGARPFTETQRRHRLLFTLAFLLMVAMILPLSLPIWDNVPLLFFVQFPWRFLGPATLLLAVVAGAAVTRLPGRSSWWLALSLVALVLFGLPWLFPNRYAPEATPTPVDLIRFEAKTGALGTTSAADYLPVTVQTLPPADTLLPAYEAAAPHYLIPRLDSAALPPSVTVIGAEYGLTEAWLQLEAAEPFQARFFWFHFPGWRAWLNGRPQPVYADTPHGLLALDVPAGRHDLRLAFGDTALRRFAWILSLFTLLIFTAVLAWWPVRSEAASVPPKVAPAVLYLREKHATRAAMMALLIGLLIFGIKSGYLDRSSNLFHRIRFDGRQVEGVQIPLQINFGNQMVLMGYDLASGAWPADVPLDLTFYWRALAPLDLDYSIGLHLVDEEGRLYGQADRLHPVGYPTSRWRTGEYARDRRPLLPWAGAPPGRYDLLIFVYEASSGRRLEMLNEVGQPVGVTYRLASIQLEPPRQPPNPAEMVVTTYLQSNWMVPVTAWALDPPPEEIDTGQVAPFVLYWRAESAPAGDYLARLRLLAPDGAAVAVARWVPGHPAFPTSQWRTGEIVRDSRAFLIPAAHPDDPARPLITGEYVLLLDLLDGGGRVQTDGVELAVLKIVAPSRSFERPQVMFPLQAQFEDVGTLIGYDLSATTLEPGDSLAVTWYWQAGAGTEVSYTTFAHLVGPDGRIYAQHDQQPLAGTRPTTGWLPGEYLSDSATLSLTADAPAGEYRLLLGLYDPATGRRLLYYEGGQAAGDHVELPGTIRLLE
jgi:hypothetical protein